MNRKLTDMKQLPLELFHFYWYVVIYISPMLKISWNYETISNQLLIYIYLNQTTFVDALK